MTDIHVTDAAEQPTAGIRETVPMAELSDFFARAFADTAAVLEEQRIAPIGAPFGRYFTMPTEVVDVEAGFPVATPIVADGDVQPGVLPGGRRLEALHVGPYDSLEIAYSDIRRYLAEHELTPGAVMWESYLNDPESEPDPARWRTKICWPVT